MVLPAFSSPSRTGRSVGLGSTVEAVALQLLDDVAQLGILDVERLYRLRNKN